MSRTTACIMRINEQLDRISGLDGAVADLLESEERRISKLVSTVLNCLDDDDPQCFTIFDDRDYDFPNLSSLKWIPFKFDDGGKLTGTLPKLYESILTFDDDFNIYIDEWCVSDGEFYLNSGWEIAKEVTHWMPLPEPPEMPEKED